MGRTSFKLWCIWFDAHGKISGEHGIGLKRMAYLKTLTPPAEYKLFEAVKKALDPAMNMNPGKIIWQEFSSCQRVIGYDVAQSSVMAGQISCQLL